MPPHHRPRRVPLGPSTPNACTHPTPHGMHRHHAMHAAALAKHAHSQGRGQPSAARCGQAELLHTTTTDAEAAGHLTQRPTRNGQGGHERGIIIGLHKKDACMHGGRWRRVHAHGVGARACMHNGARCDEAKREGIRRTTRCCMPYLWTEVSAGRAGDKESDHVKSQQRPS